MNFKVNNLLILGLLNFVLVSLAEFGHFDTFRGWIGVGGVKLKLKTNSAQLKLKLGLSLEKKSKDVRYQCPILRACLRFLVVGLLEIQKAFISLNSNFSAVQF